MGMCDSGAEYSSNELVGQQQALDIDCHRDSLSDDSKEALVYLKRVRDEATSLPSVVTVHVEQNEIATCAKPTYLRYILGRSKAYRSDDVEPDFLRQYRADLLGYFRALRRAVALQEQAGGSSDPGCDCPTDDPSWEKCVFLTQQPVS